MDEIEQHTADTDDGYRLVLQRLNGGDKGPVIMCHGLSGNSYEYLISEDEKNSLARYLANRGYDAWVVDVRGHGNSKGYFVKEENRWDYSQKADGYWSFIVDDLIQHDTPALINKIKEVTSSSKVSWIGRSMGGWLAYAHAIDGSGSTDFKGVISVASPSHFSPNIKRIMGSSPYLKKFLNSTPIDHLPAPPFQYTGGGNRPKMLNMMSSESRYVILDFLDYVSRGEIARHDYGREGNIEYYGSETPPSYWERFDKIDVPMIFITGTRDLFATPENTTESFNKVNESHGNAKLHILSGFGHINILVGKNAHDKVYPLILNGLDGFE
ncbi:MAG: alpha/beta hydrolase [Halobacteriota archaeon]|nr:alpha/beta hydrolase [Halobacteriota archaeon]